MGVPPAPSGRSRVMKMVAAGYASGRTARVREAGAAWCREPAWESGPGCPEAQSIVAPFVGSTHTRVLVAGAPRPAVTTPEGTRMEVLYPRCCGLDIHKQEVVACLIAPG